MLRRSIVCGLLFCLPLQVASFGEASAASTLRGELFVLDPGHGTRLPGGGWLNTGAEGPSGVAERDVVLAIGEDLATILRAAGARVVLTRSYANPTRIGSDKAADNRARAALANRLGATAFVALHADSSLDRRARGTSVFWLKPNSVALADAVRLRLRPLGLGEAAFHARSLAVTRVATVPAILVELGFLSNPTQERLLATPSFQRAEAHALASALIDVFGNPNATAPR